MAVTQLERIRKDVACEDEGERVVTDTKWWIAGIPDNVRPKAGFVEDLDEVVSRAVTATR